MEQAVKVGALACPYLRRVGLSGLRDDLATGALLAQARRCPVMGRVLPALERWCVHRGMHTSAQAPAAAELPAGPGDAQDPHAARVSATQAATGTSNDTEKPVQEKPAVDLVAVARSHELFTTVGACHFIAAHLNRYRNADAANCPVVGDVRAAAIAAPTWGRPVFDYEGFCASKIQAKRMDGSYRVFKNINRLAQAPPRAESPVVQYGETHMRQVEVWCSNDYLGMSRHPEVIGAVSAALQKYGAGAGGTRNISGTCQLHVELERQLADLHHRDAALLFSSCYMANDAALSTLAGSLPNCVVFSDAMNHASIIQGIRNSRARKHVFRHNDAGHLEQLLAAEDPMAPKIVVFESVYSMSGSISPVGQLCDIAHKYGALTFVDEVHAVGMYGSRGAGIAEQRGVSHKVDIYSGTLAKAYGVVGGYIAGSAHLVDMLRSFAPGFIFTTSLPPMVSAGALASVRHLMRSTEEREQQQRAAFLVKRRLADAGLPVMASPTHIVPIIVGDPALSQRVCDDLLRRHNTYVQSINYPTVPRGTERLRITPGPFHTNEMIERFVERVYDTWLRCGLAVHPGGCMPNLANLLRRQAIGSATVPPASSPHVVAAVA